jgi:hypothetical protein
MDAEIGVGSMSHITRTQAPCFAARTFARSSQPLKRIISMARMRMERSSKSFRILACFIHI